MAISKPHSSPCFLSLGTHSARIPAPTQLGECVRFGTYTQVQCIEASAFNGNAGEPHGLEIRGSSQEDLRQLRATLLYVHLNQSVNGPISAHTHTQYIYISIDRKEEDNKPNQVV